MEAYDILLFFYFHGKSLHISILEVKGQTLTDETWQISRKCCRARVHRLLKTEYKLIIFGRAIAVARKHLVTKGHNKREKATADPIMQEAT